MSDEIESLRAEVAALRAELAESTGRAQEDVTRRRLLTGLLGVGAASAAGIATAAPASAADGDPLYLGESNVATTATFLTTTVDSDESEVVLGANQWGVQASASAIGVLGSVPFGGVAGVLGYKTEVGGAGVQGEAADPGAMGVIAISQTGPAIGANSVVDGVTLELQPAERTGPPTSMPDDLTEYRVGAVSIDATGEMWLCVQTGAPGTWTRLLREDTASGRTVPITPFRALDTRATGGRPSGSPAVPGQVKGPLKGGQTVTLDLAGVDPISASATGVIGTVIAVSPTYTGYFRAAPSGQPLATTALSFTKGSTTSSAFTLPLGPDGVSFRPSGTTSNTVHLVLDITAYIT